MNLEPFKLQEVDEIREHMGDYIELDNRWDGIKGVIRRNKIQGRINLILGNSDFDKGYVHFQIYNPQKGTLSIVCLGEGCTIDDVLDDWTRGPVEREMMRYSKEYVSLADISVIECYHQEDSQE